MRLDMMPPEYREHFMTYPHLYYMEPFQVAGNLYFIGNREIGCYLLDSGEGLIILDTGFSHCAGQFFNAIWSLGFCPKDVKMIFHTHAHPDHMGSTNLLTQLSGAKTYINEVDYRELMCAENQKMIPKGLLFTPDVLTHDADAFTLGNVTVKCIDTPGHTKGCQSFFIDVIEDGKKYTASLHGGIGINTLHREMMQLTGYLTAREDFKKHIARIIDWPVDIYLGSHTFQSYMEEKYAQKIANPQGKNPCIDPTEWKTILSTALNMLEELEENERKGNLPAWNTGLYKDE